MWTAAAAWRLADEREFPARGSAEAEMLGEIVDLLADAEGRTYVLDRSNKLIQAFDAEGRHDRTIGREGAGPGELRDPGGLRWTLGALLVLDFENARYTVFDTSGAVVRDFRRLVSPKQLPWPGGLDPLGRLYDVAVAPPTPTAPPQVVLIRTDSRFVPQDTFPIPVYQRPAFELRAGGASISAGIPFAPALHWRLDPSRGHLWSGVSDRYEFTRRDLARDSILVVQKQHDAVPVTGPERDRALESLEGFRRQGGRVDESRIPETKPVFRDFWVDQDGFLWVLPTVPPGEGFVFDVFSPDGTYLGRVQGARRFFPMLVTRRAIYGMREYSEGTQHVVRYSIVRPRGE